MPSRAAKVVASSDELADRVAPAERVSPPPGQRRPTAIGAGPPGSDHVISRDPHPTDRRATLVTLTDHGQTTTAQLHAGYKEMAAALFGDVSASDLTAYTATLAHTLTRLNTMDFDEISRTAAAQRPDG